MQIHLNQTEVVELILQGKVKRALIWENFDEQYKVISSIEYWLIDSNIFQYVGLHILAFHQHMHIQKWFMYNMYWYGYWHINNQTFSNETLILLQFLITTWAIC
jgi:hypothetical protein